MALADAVISYNPHLLQVKAVSSTCSEKMEKCLNAIDYPSSQACVDFVGMAPLKFHASVNKNREQHLKPAPEIFECDLPIQDAINICKREATYTLEKALK